MCFRFRHCAENGGSICLIESQVCLTGSLTERVQALLNIDEALPFSGVQFLSTKPPTEFVLAALLNRRFSVSNDCVDEYNLRTVCNELTSIYQELFAEDSNERDDEVFTMSLVKTGDSTKNIADTWVYRIESYTPGSVGDVTRREYIRQEFVVYRFIIQGRDSVLRRAVPIGS